LLCAILHSISQKTKKCSPIYLDYLDTIHPTQSPLKSMSSGLGGVVTYCCGYVSLDTKSSYPPYKGKYKRNHKESSNTQSDASCYPNADNDLLHFPHVSPFP
jgi:hypothetical protein